MMTYDGHPSQEKHTRRENEGSVIVVVGMVGGLSRELGLDELDERDSVLR